MQTRKHSLIESIVNICVGYIVAISGQLIIFPILGKSFAICDHIVTGLFFTALSLIRSYVLRRLFNKATAKKLKNEHMEIIKCPECKTIQCATVYHGYPHNIYVHHCESCGYIITESEFFI